MSEEYWLGEGFSDNDLIRKDKAKKKPKAPKKQKKKEWEPNYWDTIGGPFNRTLLK